jgi:hypothetical protein
MSTQLASIKGKSEIVTSVANKEVTHEESLLFVTSFYGGEKRGSCIQLSLGDSFEHIQLEGDAVKELVDVLRNWLNKPGS